MYFKLTKKNQRTSQLCPLQRPLSDLKANKSNAQVLQVLPRVPPPSGRVPLCSPPPSTHYLQTRSLSRNAKQFSNLTPLKPLVVLAI